MSNSLPNNNEIFKNYLLEIEKFIDDAKDIKSVDVAYASAVALKFSAMGKAFRDAFTNKLININQFNKLLEAQLQCIIAINFSDIYLESGVFLEPTLVSVIDNKTVKAKYENLYEAVLSKISEKIIYFRGKNDLADKLKKLDIFKGINLVLKIYNDQEELGNYYKGLGIITSQIINELNKELEDLRDGKIKNSASNITQNDTFDECLLEIKKLMDNVINDNVVDNDHIKKSLAHFAATSDLIKKSFMNDKINKDQHEKLLEEQCECIIKINLNDKFLERALVIKMTLQSGDGVSINKEKHSESTCKKLYEEIFLKITETACKDKYEFTQALDITKGIASFIEYNKSELGSYYYGFKIIISEKISRLERDLDDLYEKKFESLMDNSINDICSKIQTLKSEDEAYNSCNNFMRIMINIVNEMNHLKVKGYMSNKKLHDLINTLNHKVDELNNSPAFKDRKLYIGMKKIPVENEVEKCTVCKVIAQNSLNKPE